MKLDTVSKLDISPSKCSFHLRYGTQPARAAKQSHTIYAFQFLFARCFFQLHIKLHPTRSTDQLPVLSINLTEMSSTVFLFIHFAVNKLQVHEFILLNQTEQILSDNSVKPEHLNVLNILLESMKCFPCMLLLLCTINAFFDVIIAQNVPSIWLS